MGFDKVKMRQIRGLLIFAAALILLIIYSGTVWGGIKLFFGIVTPFLAGGAIAFVLNLPMNWVENKLLGKWKGKVADKIKRNCKDCNMYDTCTMRKNGDRCVK